MVTVEERVQWIKDYFTQSDGNHAVIGMSGGKDSLLTAMLCVKALGADKVYGVLMPMYDVFTGRYVGESSVKAEMQCLKLGIKYDVVNVYPAVQALLSSVCKGEVNADVGRERMIRVNMPARIRMCTLYAAAQGGGRVACTSNLSEDYVGWNTKYGDGAGDFQPLADLTATEVWEMLNEICDEFNIVPDDPSYPGAPADGLCGMTDEDALGCTYAQIDALIREGTSGNTALDIRLRDRCKLNKHKLDPPIRP